MDQPFNRAAEDVGNIVKLEHINVRMTDQGLATTFYVTGLGMTRDPYVATGTRLMWINIGPNQVHLPSGGPDVLRGTTLLVVPDREQLLRRLAGVKDDLAGTRFDFRKNGDSVEVTCPWGNRFRCYAPDAARFGRIVLGMPGIEFDVVVGAAAPIAKFYQQVMATGSRVGSDGAGAFAQVDVGANQHLRFRETSRPEAPYDAHHLQIYVADFSGPYKRLGELGLITADHLEHEYRFKDITDLATGKAVFTVEHEVRSMRHPLYGRHLVNRNPQQTNRDYMPGHDAMAWGMD